MNNEFAAFGAAAKDDLLSERNQFAARVQSNAHCVWFGQVSAAAGNGPLHKITISAPGKLPWRTSKFHRHLKSHYLCFDCCHCAALPINYKSVHSVSPWCCIIIPTRTYTIGNNSNDHILAPLLEASVFSFLSA
jgi:hypothetical protein